jgi:hypothetical protein
MEEQRQFERFTLTIPARMETITSGKKHVFELKTRDISAAGAFIDTAEKFSEGTRFKMDFTVPNDKVKELTGARSLIECEGSVVRFTDTGMAVRFNGDCNILGLKGL